MRAQFTKRENKTGMNAKGEKIRFNRFPVVSDNVERRKGNE